MIQYAAVAALIIAIAAFFIGRENGLSEYHELRATLAAQQKQAEADAEAARIASERVTADVSQSWANALDWQRQHPLTVRVRTHCDREALPAVPGTGLSAYAATTQSGLGSPIDVAVEQCEKRLNDAALDASMVMHLQHWIKQQHEVKQ